MNALAIFHLRLFYAILTHMARDEAVIGIVGLNPTIDKIYEIENFSAGFVFRPRKQKVSGGGKGVNIARVLKTLGMKHQLLLSLGGYVGEKIKEGLEREQINIKVIKIDAPSRVCTLILDPINCKQTVINEQGPEVSNREEERIKTVYADFVKDKQMVVIAGTTPVGMPDDIYAEFIEISHRHNIAVILDTSGRRLKLGLRKRPLMIKPNLTELGQIAKRKIASLQQIRDIAKKLTSSGPEMVATSLGKDGVLLTNGTNSWQATPPKVNVVNAVGSGDAFVAGFAYSWVKKRQVTEVLRMGVATGTANALTVKPGYCSKKDIRRLYSLVKIKKL